MMMTASAASPATRPPRAAPPEHDVPHAWRVAKDTQLVHQEDCPAARLESTVSVTGTSDERTETEVIRCLDCGGQWVPDEAP
jgi:hypothetical protein